MSLALMRRGALDQNRTSTPGWTYQALPTSGPSGLKIPIPPGFKIWFSDGLDYTSRSTMLSAAFNGLPVYSAYSGQDAAYSTSWWDPTHLTCTGSQAVLSGFFDAAIVATKYVTGGFSTGPLATNGNVPAGALWLWCVREESADAEPIKTAQMTYGTEYPFAGQFTKNGVAAGNADHEWPYDGEADVREGDTGAATSSTRLHWHNPSLVASNNTVGEDKTTASTLTVDTTQWVIHGCYTGPDGTFHALTNDAAGVDQPLREWLTLNSVDTAFTKAGRRFIVQQEAYGQPSGGTPTKKVYVDWVACLVPTAVGNSTPPAQILDLTKFKVTLPIDVNGLNVDTPWDWKHPQIEKAAHGNFFFPTDAGDGVVLRANCGGARTSGSSYARCELREMTALDGTEGTGWAPGDGATHTMTLVQSIDHLPDHRPQIVCSQIHGADTRSFVLVYADGYTVPSGTTYVKGSDAGAFAIRVKVNNASSVQTLNVVGLSGVHLGDKFSTKIVATGGQVLVYMDYGSAGATTLVAPVTADVPASGCYFKAGTYVQSNPTNNADGKVVPGGLTAPIASGQPTGDAGVTEYGQTTMYNVQVSHGVPAVTAPSSFLSFNQHWKLTLPIHPDGTLGNGGGVSPLEITRTALDTYSHASYFYVNNGVEVAFVAPANGATTSNTANPRCELRERNPPALASADDAAWSTAGGVHTLYIVGRVLQLPQNKPQLVIMQAHDPNDDFEIIADGFCPTDSGTAVTGTNPGGFCIAHRNWQGSQQYDIPLIQGVHIGDLYSIALQFNPGNSVKMYASLGVVDETTLLASNLRKTFAGGANKTGCYFKAGAYTQANSWNNSTGAAGGTPKHVPSTTFPGLPALTSPAPGSNIAGEPAGSAGIAAIRTLTVTHV